METGRYGGGEMWGRGDAETQRRGDMEGDMEIETIIRDSAEQWREHGSVSPCLRVSASPCPRIPASPFPRIPASPCPRVPASLRLRLSALRFFSILFTCLLI